MISHLQGNMTTHLEFILARIGQIEEDILQLEASATKAVEGSVAGFEQATKVSLLQHKIVVVQIILYLTKFHLHWSPSLYIN